MWFRRKRKTDTNNALGETLRSLQGLLDDTVQTDGRAARSGHGATSTQPAPRLDPPIEESSPTAPPPTLKRKPHEPGVDKGAAGLPPLRSPQPRDSAITEPGEPVPATAPAARGPRPKEHPRAGPATSRGEAPGDAGADGIPILEHAIDQARMESMVDLLNEKARDPGAPDSSDTPGKAAGAAGEDPGNTLERIPVLNTVVFEPETEHRPRPPAPAPATTPGMLTKPARHSTSALLPTETEHWINQVIDSYNIRLRLADAPPMDPSQEYELRETLADIMLDRITNFDNK